MTWTWSSKTIFRWRTLLRRISYRLACFAANMVFITLELVFVTIAWAFTAMDKLVTGYRAFLCTRTRNTSVGVSRCGKIVTRSSNLRKVDQCNGFTIFAATPFDGKYQNLQPSSFTVFFIFSQWSYMCS